MPASSEQRKVLYIPMEIVERELNGNISLAVEAVKEGWCCVIGTKRTIFDLIPDLPPGVMFLKSITAAELGRLRRLKNAGHKLVCLDVEGLIYTSLEEFVTVRFSSETIRETDLLLFWGDLQRQAVANTYPNFSDRLITTGSHICDLWRPQLHEFFQERVNELKGRYGPYILIPSSFGTANHYLGKRGNLEIMQRDKMVAEEKHEEFYQFWEDYENHVGRIFKSFLDLLPSLSAAFPDHTLIIRPHPSEKHQTWKDASSGLNNVKVIFEGVVSPWLLGADAILHWGCTTGLEAFMMGRPVVAYNPSTEAEDQRFEHKLPHSISLISRTPEETIEALKGIVCGRADTATIENEHVAEGRDELQKWIYDSPCGSAAAEIIAELDNLPVTAVAPISKVSGPKPSLKELAWSLFEMVSKWKWVKVLLPKRIVYGVNARAYGRHKTKDIDFKVFSDSVRRMARIKGVDNIRARQLKKNLYVVEETYER